MNEMELQLNQYYERVGISPVCCEDPPEEMFNNFRCPNKVDCQNYCEASGEFEFQPRIEGVEVSQCYYGRAFRGHSIPRIVVVSLSAPRPGSHSRDDSSSQRNEGNGLNPHWRETLAMIRSLLYSFIASQDFPRPARYSSDRSTAQIAQLFVHVRTAKCSSRPRKEPPQVYENCGDYLGEELRILKPNVIVTQGDDVHWQLKKHVLDAETVRGINIVNLRRYNRKVCWLQTYHPGYPRGFYRQSGSRIDSEREEVGAMREHFVCYGDHIKNLMRDGVL